MSETERRLRYDNRRVLIETERVLDPQFRSTLLTLTGAQIELLRNVVAYLNQSSTFVTEYFDTYYLTPTASEWDSLQSIVADLEETLMGIIFQDDYVCVREVQGLGTHGGTFAGGAWRTRNINNEQSDAGGICDIGSNQVTLKAGTYRCLIACPAYRVNLHQARLRNITGDASILNGTSMFASFAQYGYNRSQIAGSFTLATETILEIQHYCSSTYEYYGFGNAVGIVAEVYTIAEFWRRAIP